MCIFVKYCKKRQSGYFWQTDVKYNETFCCCNYKSALNIHVTKLRQHIVCCFYYYFSLNKSCLYINTCEISFFTNNFWNTPRIDLILYLGYFLSFFSMKKILIIHVHFLNSGTCIKYFEHFDPCIWVYLIFAQFALYLWRTKF